MLEFGTKKPKNFGANHSKISVPIVQKFQCKIACTEFWCIRVYKVSSVVHGFFPAWVIAWNIPCSLVFLHTDIICYFSSLLVNSGYFQLPSTTSTTILLLLLMAIKPGCHLALCSYWHHQWGCFFLIPGLTGKNTGYAKYVWRSRVIVPRILGRVRHNMACAKLGASASWNSLRTRESGCMWLVKLAQKVKKMTKEAKKKSIKIREVVKKKVNKISKFKKVKKIFF